MQTLRTYSDGSKTNIENSADWQREALDFDWFDGDAGEHTFSDKIVVARHSKAKCTCCLSLSTPGTLVRVRVEVVDGEIMRYRWCHECCHAAVLDTNACDEQGRDNSHSDYDDESQPIENRWALRAANKAQDGDV